MFSRLLFLVQSTCLLTHKTLDYVATKFDIYQTEGYKPIVAYYVNKYNSKEDRPYTEEELTIKDQKADALIQEILEEIKNEEK